MKMNAPGIVLKFVAPLLVMIPLNVLTLYGLYKQGKRTGERRDSVTVTLVSLSLSLAFVILRSPNMSKVWCGCI